MGVRLTRKPIDDRAMIERVTQPANGGVCTFCGVVRDNMDGRPVIKLEYESYEPRAIKELQRIVGQVHIQYAVSTCCAGKPRNQLGQVIEVGRIRPRRSP